MTGLSSETTAEQDRLGRRCRLCEHLMMVVGSPKERVQRTSAREHRKSPQAGSNHRPFAYEASALPSGSSHHLSAMYPQTQHTQTIQITLQNQDIPGFFLILRRDIPGHTGLLLDPASSTISMILTWSSDAHRRVTSMGRIRRRGGPSK